MNLDERVGVLWTQTWNQVLREELDQERSRGYTEDRFYRSGRASKAYPEKEGPDWWLDHGPGFVKSWVQWRDNMRQANGLKVWTTPDGEAGIELRLYAERGDTSLVSQVDRVMVDDDGNLWIIDLKSGSMSQAWPRQLIMNNLGLFAQYGVRAKWGGFWSARKGGVDPVFDLSIYTDDWMWTQLDRAREIRDRGLFVAQPTNLCNSSCGVRDYCAAVGGIFSSTVDATLTHNLRSEGDN